MRNRTMNHDMGKKRVSVAQRTVCDDYRRRYCCVYDDRLLEENRIRREVASKSDI